MKYSVRDQSVQWAMTRSKHNNIWNVVFKRVGLGGVSIIKYCPEQFADAHCPRVNIKNHKVSLQYPTAESKSVAKNQIWRRFQHPLIISLLGRSPFYNKSICQMKQLTSHIEWIVLILHLNYIESNFLQVWMSVISFIHWKAFNL